MRNESSVLVNGIPEGDIFSWVLILQTRVKSQKCVLADNWKMH